MQTELRLQDLFLAAGGLQNQKAKAALHESALCSPLSFATAAFGFLAPKGWHLPGPLLTPQTDRNLITRSLSISIQPSNKQRCVCARARRQREELAMVTTTDWGPIIVAVVLFILLSPGFLFQLPARVRVVEFGNMGTSALAILVHAILYFCILTIVVVAIGVHVYTTKPDPA